MGKPIDPGVDIGHVHLKVADLDRAVAFYSGVLGFEVVARMGDAAAFLSAGGYHHHIGLNTWESRGGSAPPRGTTGLYHAAIRYPSRAALGDALGRLEAANIRLDAASDHGVSEALYLRDPDGNGLELYVDRPRAEWPRHPDGTIAMGTERLDVESLRAAAEAERVGRASAAAQGAAASVYAPMQEELRQALRELRSRLLHLHKVLLDDTRAAYEMDRGRVASNAQLLQLVIHDPWFAWLHALSELVVRIDETVEHEAPATRADAMTLVEQVERLLTASESGEGFARRYYDALQRQPAVVVAHAEVRRVLKGLNRA